MNHDHIHVPYPTPTPPYNSPTAPQGVPPIGRVACSVINLSLFYVLGDKAQGERNQTINQARGIRRMMLDAPSASLPLVTNCVSDALKLVDEKGYAPGPCHLELKLVSHESLK